MLGTTTMEGPDSRVWCGNRVLSSWQFVGNQFGYLLIILFSNSYNLEKDVIVLCISVYLYACMKHDQYPLN
jgi:hypothetical protein